MKNPLNMLQKRLTKLRMSFAQWLVGTHFRVAPADAVRIAGCVVLWYEQDGFKHFVLVRATDPDQDGLFRFPSFFGLVKNKDAADTMKLALQFQLGQNFAKNFDLNVLNLDRIAATPTFRWQDDKLNSQDIVQVLVWVAQITPQHAEMIQTAPNLQYRIVPEFGIAGSKISTAHKQIFQAVQRQVASISGISRLPEDIADRLHELFNDSEIIPANRTIH